MATTAEKYITFETRIYAHKRTSNYLVRNIRTNAICGEVKWYGGFRKFCFFPSSGFLFDPSCLRLIADFIDDLMAKRRKKKVQ